MELPIRCNVKDFLPLEKLEGFQGNMKQIKSRDLERLIGRILEHGIITPVFVWRDGEKNKILDGHQRVKAYKTLIKRGYKIDKVPVVFIDAKDEEEAKRELIAIMSSYGTVSRKDVIEELAELTKDIEKELEKYRLTTGELKIKNEESQEVKGEVQLSQYLDEHHNYVVLYCDNDIAWLQCKSLFEIGTVKVEVNGVYREGTARVIRWEDAVEKIKKNGSGI